MPSIKVIFRESSGTSGEGTLFFRVIHRRAMRQINTGCRLLCAEWDAGRECVIIAGVDSRKEYLRCVQMRLVKGRERMLQIVSVLEKSGRDYTVSDIVERYPEPGTLLGFVSFASRQISELRLVGKARLAEHYTTSLNSFLRFRGAEEIPFEEFDDKLLVGYERYLQARGLCPNTTSYYMRNLRAIYNRAVEEGLAVAGNPFRHVYTGIAKTVKRAVGIDTIKALRGLDLRHDPSSELARDLFLFSFYTRGMAIVDVAFLRKRNLQNGSLVYRRQKTGQLLTIKWEPQMQALACRYGRRESDFIFPLIDSSKPDYRRQYVNAYTKINRRLKRLGKMLGLVEPLTFHRSRHGWASIARSNNVPLAVISEGMGHDSEKTTRIYLASLDASVVDQANSEILSLLDE